MEGGVYRASVGVWSADLQMLKGESAGGGMRAVRSSKGTLHSSKGTPHDSSGIYVSCQINSNTDCNTHGHVNSKAHRNSYL